MFTIIKIFFLFIFFGFLGWLIDSSYRYFVDGSWKPGTHISFFSPIYAIGGVILLLIFSRFKIDFAFQALIGGSSLILLEFFSGVFSEKVMGKKYWDYSKNSFNYKGRIDAWHSFCWFVITIFFGLIFCLLSGKTEVFPLFW